jgi:hypothetical protein
MLLPTRPTGVRSVIEFRSIIGFNITVYSYIGTLWRWENNGTPAGKIRRQNGCQSKEGGVRLRL